MNKQEMKLAKVRKSCHTAKTVTNVFFILVMVAAILCVAAGGIVFAKRETVNKAITDREMEEEIDIEMSHSVGSGLLQFDFDDSGLLEEGQYAKVIVIYCAIAAVFCAFAAAIFRAIWKIFVIIEESESPFHPEVLKKLKRIFIVLTIGAGLVTGIGTGLVLMGLVFWCIYCIMDYGMALQEEVDEIL